MLHRNELFYSLQFVFLVYTKMLSVPEKIQSITANNWILLNNEW